MHGDGARRVCSECGTPVSPGSTYISHRELRGPRNITSSNIDRVFDDHGNRVLFIEEKSLREASSITAGQKGLLYSLARIPNAETWVAIGDVSEVTVYRLHGRGPSDQLLHRGCWEAYQDLVEKWYAS